MFLIEFLGVFQIYLLCILGVHILSYHQLNKWLFIQLSLIAFGFAMLSLAFPPERVILLTIPIILTFSLYLMIQTKKPILTSLPFFILLIIAIAQQASLLITSFIIGLSVSDTQGTLIFVTDVYLSILADIIGILLTILLCFLLRSIIWTKLMTLNQHTHLLISFILFSTLNFIITALTVRELLDFSMAYLLFFIYTVTLIMSLSFYIQSLETKYQVKKKEDEYQAIQSYTDTLEKHQLDIQKFKHDYHNILISLSGYIEDEDLQGLKAYFKKEVIETSKIMYHPFKLEKLSKIKQKSIKSMLTTKLIMAQEFGIDVSFEASENIKDISMDIVDFIRILGIILDNAIEELLVLEKGRLLVGLFKDVSATVCIVQNTCRTTIPSIHQLREIGFSMKGEKRGFGLSSLEEITSKYQNVALKTSIFENQFIQELTIGHGKNLT